METKKNRFSSVKDLLSRDEMRAIIAGDPEGLFSCSATPNCCNLPGNTCSCQGGGTCSADEYEATCTCDDGTSATIKCVR